ncbi:MAG TPA: stage III sporulation protein AF [Clostridia bacterium]|jgi:stage III sporulation protein AF|nr:stage III sporulation protein AF [Clostridiaceae bacterium]HOA31208.1 stage III sporulation protein AF [Clostridia bacterium]HPZ51556.1 stage III sporulation protein AF [Clostridia bacterium]
MKEWLFTIIVSSFLLTMLLQLVPDGNIKKTCKVAFGFVFLAVIISPLTDLADGFFKNINNNKIQVNLAYSELLAGVKDAEEYNMYTDEVMNQYVNRLEKEVNDALMGIGVVSDTVIVVNRDIESDSFGFVASVSCNVRLEDGKKEKKSIVKPIDKIDKIVIGTDGIKVKKHKDEEGEKKISEEKKEKEKEIRYVVSLLLGVDEKNISIDWV